MGSLRRQIGVASLCEPSLGLLQDGTKEVARSEAVHLDDIVFFFSFRLVKGVDYDAGNVPNRLEYPLTTLKGRMMLKTQLEDGSLKVRLVVVAK